MQVQCPACASAINAPDSLAGQVVACQSCGAQMQLPALAIQPVPAVAEAVPESPAAAAGAETKACPHCGATILKVAKKCKHCRSFAIGVPAPAGRQGGKIAPRGRLKQRRSGDGRMALIFALIGLVPICAITCNVTGLLRSIPILELPISIMPVFALLAVIYGAGARKFEAERRLATAGMVLGLSEFGLLALAFVFVIYKGFTA